MQNKIARQRKTHKLVKIELYQTNAGNLLLFVIIVIIIIVIIIYSLSFVLLILIIRTEITLNSLSTVASTNMPNTAFLPPPNYTDNSLSVEIYFINLFFFVFLFFDVTVVCVSSSVRVIYRVEAR